MLAQGRTPSTPRSPVQGQARLGPLTSAEWPSMKEMMVGSDSSEGAERAASVAADVAKAIDGRLLLVNVSQYGLSQLPDSTSFI